MNSIKMRVKIHPLIVSLSTLLSYFTIAFSASMPQLARRAAPNGYAYFGCVLNYPGSFDPILPDYGGLSQTGMTLEKCAIVCGYAIYFLVTGGNTCRCSNGFLTNPLTYGGDEDCNIPCSGNVRAGKSVNDEYCGGNSYFSIYSHNAGTLPPSTTDLSYYPLGCYIEAEEKPVVGGDTVLRLVRDLTIQKCEALCKGFSHFALREGQYCLCGDKLDSKAQTTTLDVCNEPCTGNNLQKCGSEYDPPVNVYVTPSYAACGDIDTDLRIRNPGFENGMISWESTTLSTGKAAWQSVAYPNPVSGKRVARISMRGAVYPLDLSAQTIQVCPYIGYVLHFWVLGSSTGTCDIEVDSNGQNFASATAANRWIKNSAGFQSLTESVSLTFRIKCYGFGFEQVFLDNIQLRPATIDDWELFPRALG